MCLVSSCRYCNINSTLAAAVALPALLSAFDDGSRSPVTRHNIGFLRMYRSINMTFMVISLGASIDNRVNQNLCTLQPSLIESIR